MKVTFAEIREAVTENDKQRFKLIRIDEAGAGDGASKEDDGTEKDAETKSQPSKSAAKVNEDDDPRNYLIRANQGHSIRTIAADDLLTRILPTDPAENIPSIAVHGTTHAAWPAIVASGGLKPMGRNHVHFASGLPAGLKPESHQSSSSSKTTTDEREEDTATTAAPVISGMRNSSTILIFLDVARALAAGLELYRSANGVILSPGITRSNSALEKKVPSNEEVQAVVQEIAQQAESKPEEDKEKGPASVDFLTNAIEKLAVAVEMKVADSSADAVTPSKSASAGKTVSAKDEKAADDDATIPLEFFSRVEDRTGKGENGLLVLDGKIIREAPAAWVEKSQQRQGNRRGGRGGGSGGGGRGGR
jgi:2'-phosphotransferase